MKIKELNQEDWPFKALFTGEPGTRKTTASASFPGKIYMMDIDNKGHAMYLPHSKGLINSELEYESFDSWFKIQDKLNSLQTNCPYDTVIFDSVTAAGDVINRSTMKAKSANGKKIAGISVNSIEDYNAETSALMEAVTLGLALKCNFIMIAHVIRRDGDATARTLVTGGKVVGAKMPAYFPEVFHFRAVESIMEGGPSEYQVTTQHTGVDFARTTLPLPPNFSWTDKNFYKTMTGNMDGVEIQGGKTEKLSGNQLT